MQPAPEIAPDTAPGKQALFIIGGSNSLRKDGWVNNLAHFGADRIEVRNLAIGAATSLMGTYRILNGEVPGGATVIWEYAINETQRHGGGRFYGSIFRNLDWFLETCARRAIRVLPVVFWTRREQVGTQRNEYRRAIVERLRARGVSPLDFGKIVTEFSTRRNIPVAKLYSDGLHYRRGSGLFNMMAKRVLKNLGGACIPSRNPSLADREIFLARPEAAATGLFSNSVVTADIHAFTEGVGISTTGNLLAFYLIGSKQGGAVEVVIDGQSVGTYSAQCPLKKNLPPRLLKHIVLGGEHGGGHPVSGTLAFRAGKADGRPVVQKSFVWHPTSGPRDDGFIAALMERPRM